jgi:hypothetical protein
MPSYVNVFFEERVDRLFHLADTVNQAFAAAGIEYRILGGLATYLYLEEAEPDAGRLTRDIDILVRREDVEAITAAVRPYGLEHRHVAGVDMLVQTEQPSARRAVRLVFAGEKVRPEYREATPPVDRGRTICGLRLVLLEDLVRMKPDQLPGQGRDAYRRLG